MNNILIIVMNQKFEQVFSSGQQNKFRQLQQEVSALEEQLQDALLKQLPVDDRNTYLPISLPRGARSHCKN